MAKRIKKVKSIYNGFTLVEMIVVVFIVAVGLLGILSIYNINTSNQYEIRREAVASGLAQEGMELVRNLRDYNQMNGLDWWEGLCSSATGPCSCSSIDYNSLTTHACTSNTDVCFSSGRYSQCASGNTDFTRTITLSRNGDLSAGGYISVSCDVSWDSGEKKATATSMLYDNSF